MVKNLPASAGDMRGRFSPWVRSPLEKGIAAESRIFSWRISCTEQPGGLVHGVSKSQTQLKRLSSSSSMNAK